MASLSLGQQSSCAGTTPTPSFCPSGCQDHFRVSRVVLLLSLRLFPVILVTVCFQGPPCPAPSSREEWLKLRSGL